MTTARDIREAVQDAVFNDTNYVFRNRDMDGIVAEALTAAFQCGMDANPAVLDMLRESLIEKVRNYMLTGDPNGQR